MRDASYYVFLARGFLITVALGQQSTLFLAL